MSTVQNVGNAAYSNKKIQRHGKVYIEGMKIKCGNGQEAKQILNESIWLFADAQLKQGETSKTAFTGFLLCGRTASLCSTTRA